MITADKLATTLQRLGLHLSVTGDSTDDRGAAALLDCTTRTLANWRDEGSGPDCYRLAGWVYRLDDLASFMNSRALHWKNNEKAH